LKRQQHGLEAVPGGAGDVARAKALLRQGAHGRRLASRRQVEEMAQAGMIEAVHDCAY
jgi:hypothetical protein